MSFTTQNPAKAQPIWMRLVAIDREDFALSGGCNIRGSADPLRNGLAQSLKLRNLQFFHYILACPANIDRRAGNFNML